jgi:tetratricopeptide (TPR) repeat protein
MRHLLAFAVLPISLLLFGSCNISRSALYVDHGSKLYEKGEYAEAAEAYRDAIRIMPGNGPALVGLGNSLWQLGRKEECVEAYRQAMRVAPDYAPAYYGFVHYQEILSGPDAALRALIDITRDQPTNALAYGECGLLYLGMGRYADARAALDRAARLDPRILDVPRFRNAHEQVEDKARSRDQPEQ